MYTKLFSPAKIGNVTVKNRLVMSPMGTGIANIDGTPSEAIIRFYEERAMGGCGLIYTEVCRINDYNGGAMLRQLALTRDSQIPAMGRLTAAVHKYGTKIFCQLHHPGRQTFSALCGNQPLVSASAIPCGYNKQPTRALETEEVKMIIRNYVDSAVRAQKSGFDGVEVHGGHGYLPEQFMSLYTNKRTDEYGGSFENRMRFCVEIVEGIHAACGEDYPVTLRMPGDEFLNTYGVTEPYIDNQEAVRIAVAMEKAGYAALNVTCGTYEARFPVVDPTAYEQGWKSVFIKPIKDAVTIPVIAVNHVCEPEVGEQLIEDGVQDFISMGRAWIADPAWGVKALEGRSCDICRCIGCVNCFADLEKHAMDGTPPACSVNPRAFKETVLPEVTHDADDRSVAVVGSGPAGMCAALTAAQRGMKVTLFEKEGRLGGLVNYASASPVKAKMRWIIDWYEKQLADAGVEVRLNCAASRENISALNPDAVIVASGARPKFPISIPGIHGENVYSIIDVLGGKADLRDKKVLIVGAGITGLECGEYLNAKGCRTVIMDMTDRPAPNDYHDIVDDDVARLKKNGTEFMMQHSLREITAAGVVAHNLESDCDVEISADAVVISLGLDPQTEILEELRGQFENVVAVGGVADVGGKIPGATNDAYQCVLNLFREPAKASFHLSKEDCARFSKECTMFGQKGVFAAYLTDMSAIERILPPPLKPFMMPVVTLSLCHIQSSTVCKDYYEAILGVYATYNDIMGLYPVALILDGQGKEAATTAGREVYGYPKKIDAQFFIDKDDEAGLVRIRVSRKGSTLVNLTMKLGEYNSMMTEMIYAGPGAGRHVEGCSFCYKYDATNANGQTQFADGKLLMQKCAYDYEEWIPGNAEITISSGNDDPWGELPVRSVIGGAFTVNQLNMGEIFAQVPVDANEVVPYLLTSRYDRSCFGEHLDL